MRHTGDNNKAKATITAVLLIAAAAIFAGETATRWSFNSKKNESENLPLLGTAMSEFSVERAVGHTKVTDGVNDEGLFISKAVFSLPAGWEFDAARDAVTIAVDELVIEIPAGGFEEREHDFFVHQDRELGLRMTLDVTKGEWTLRYNGDSAGIQAADGLNVYMVIGQVKGGAFLNAAASTRSK